MFHLKISTFLNMIDDNAKVLQKVEQMDGFVALQRKLVDEK